MKRFAPALIMLILLVLFSCKKDEGYISMSAIEGAVWIEINEFRTDNSKNAATANYDTMVEQAKIFSAQMAAGDQPVDGSGLTDIWNTIYERWGGTNQISIVSKTTKGSSDISVEDIIDPIKNNAKTAEALLEDINIGGVGIAYDSKGNAYTTILMMKVASN
jgi:hypothetical protein